MREPVPSYFHQVSGDIPNHLRLRLEQSFTDIRCKEIRLTSLQALLTKVVQDIKVTNESLRALINKPDYAPNSEESCALVAKSEKQVSDRISLEISIKQCKTDIQNARDLLETIKADCQSYSAISQIGADTDIVLFNPKSIC